uniref:acetyl-coenzyme A synthetase N-terminal domain-containing protein n=1 Tax=Limnohabitans sp. TaxID=1907725 RepID=UPI00404802E1
MSSTIYQPSADFVKNAHVSGMAAYEELCKEAESDYQGYWARLAKEMITWKTPFTQVLDESNAPFFKWFEDGTRTRHSASGRRSTGWSVQRAANNRR